MSEKISSFDNSAYLGKFAFNNWTLWRTRKCLVLLKSTLEHSAVPRLNEHPETNIKMAVAGAGGAFPFAPDTDFFRQNSLSSSYSLEEILHKANITLGYLKCRKK